MSGAYPSEAERQAGGSAGEEPRGPFEPEFTDEGPGTYLAEWGTGRASRVWGLFNLLGTLGLGTALHLRPIGPESEWLTLASLVWSLLPVSAVLLIVFTLWQLGTAYTPKSPRNVLWAVGGSLAALAVWGACAWGLGVLAAPQE